MIYSRMITVEKPCTKGFVSLNLPNILPRLFFVVGRDRCVLILPPLNSLSPSRSLLYGRSSFRIQIQTYYGFH